MDNEITLAEAIAVVERNKDSGVFSHCPCCKQGVKVYERTILGTMVMQLKFMLERAPVEPKSLPFLSSGGIYAQLRYWNLARQDVNGNWFGTRRGRLFLEDKIRVPQIAYVYNQTFLGYNDKTVGVRDCMKKRFDYDEVMGTTL